MKVKFLMSAEIEISDRRSLERGTFVDEAQAKLDAFREATLPRMNYGITLFRTRAGEPGLDQDPYILSQGFSVKEW